MTRALARAPGRVNVIGEHTDYNGGFVFPCAISSATTALYDATGGNVLTVESTLGTSSFDLDAMPHERLGDWRDYARGVIVELQRAGVDVKGGTLHVESNVPIGAGLSSSASFEVALALALSGPAAGIDRPGLAKLAQRAENAYAGANSGIMDQFAVLFAKREHVLLLDTRSLAFEAVRFPAHLALVVANSMQRHEVSGGQYNVRREQCEAAAALLQHAMPQVEQLRDVTIDDLARARRILPDDLYRRARHVVTENARVIEAADALRRNDCAAAGEVMNASHDSLRFDYEVSTPHLDALVEIARECGAYGSRMTGAGFGGCTVSLVERENAETFGRQLARRYHERTGISPEIYDGTPSDGAWVRDA